jgi:hypothetical protein
VARRCGRPCGRSSNSCRLPHLTWNPFDRRGTAAGGRPEWPRRGWSSDHNQAS